MKLSPGVAVDIMAAESVGRHRLKLTFSDGHVSIVDFDGFLRSSLNPETREFLNEARFRKFSLVHGNLVWGDYEMCFSLEDLYNGTISAEKPTGQRLAVAEDRAEYGAKKLRRK
jgi:hypothetical protein